MTPDQLPPGFWLWIDKTVDKETARLVKLEVANPARIAGWVRQFFEHQSYQ